MTFWTTPFYFFFEPKQAKYGIIGHGNT